MADVITRLIVDSQDYDNKIKRAAQGLQHYADACKKAGGTLEFVDDEAMEFARSLGKMQTAAKSAEGELSELKTAFKEMSVLYKRLSDEEKKGAFGKAMEKSLGELKGRVKELGTQLKEANSDIEGSSGVLEALANKVGIPTEMFTKLGLAAAAVGAALKVATDAFKQNEILMDEWGRFTEGAKGVYEGFLNALNTGDFSGFLSRIREIVSASEAAYDAMDALGTFNAFNQINKERAKTNLQQSIADYREGKGTKADVEAARDALISELEAQQNFELNAYKDAIKEVAKTHKGVNADRLYELLYEGSYQDFEALKALQPSKRETYTYQEYEYNPLDPTGMGGSYVTKTGTRMVAANEQEELAAMLRQLTDEELKSLQALGAQANRTGTEIEQVRRQAIRYGGTAVAATTKATEAVAPKGSIAAAKKNLAELREQWELATDDNKRAELKIQIDEVTQAIKEMSGEMEKGAKTATDMWKEYSATIAELKNRVNEFNQMAGDINLSDDQRDWARGMAETYQKQLDKMRGDTEEIVEEITQELEEIPTAFDNFRDGVGAVGSMVGALDSLKTIGEDLTAVFNGEMDAWDSLMTVINSGLGVLQAVITVTEALNTLNTISIGIKKAKEAADQSSAATAVASAATEVAATSAVTTASATATGVKAGEAAAGAGKAMSGIPFVGPALAVVAIGAVLAAVLTAVNKAKAGSYASGGIIPGSSFSGDNQIAAVNAGELILNRAQTANLAGQLTSGGIGNLRLTTELSGENIRIALSNNNRRRGGSRGEYAISK